MTAKEPEYRDRISPLRAQKGTEKPTTTKDTKEHEGERIPPGSLRSHVGMAKSNTGVLAFFFDQDPWRDSILLAQKGASGPRKGQKSTLGSTIQTTN